MRKFLLISAIAAMGVVLAVNAFGFTREAAVFEGANPHFTLSQDCLLQAYNTCSGWVWMNTDVPGAVWGTVMNPNDCEGGCTNGGAVSDIWFWGYCSPGAPATFGDVAVELVDATGCPMTSLWNSGPMSIYTCVSGNRWTHLQTPINETLLDGQDFAISVEWGPASPIMIFATDNGLANLMCWLGYLGTYPGCAATIVTCSDWCCPSPPQVTYAYLTDFTGDTVPEDVCGTYGVPYPLMFPYVFGYGYQPNNLIIIVGLDCYSPTAVENTSWGHVKALFE